MPRALLLAVALCASPLPAGGLPATSAAPRAVDHSALDRVLREVVRDELVDYRAIRDAHLGALDGYLERMAAVAADALPRDAQLAYYINVYNATVLREVARRYEPGYAVSRDSFALFDAPLVRLARGAVSLNALEHEIVRPGFEEPRIHVALVCAARSCPPLLPRTYRAADLDALLERGMRRFVNDPSRNEIDVERRTLRLSRLFDWYAEDFGGPQGRVAYVDRYADEDVAGFDVGFLEYDWSLNVAPPR